MKIQPSEPSFQSSEQVADAEDARQGQVEDAERVGLPMLKLMARAAATFHQRPAGTRDDAFLREQAGHFPAGILQDAEGRDTLPPRG